MWIEDILKKNWKIAAGAGTIVIVIILAAILSSSSVGVDTKTADQVIQPAPDKWDKKSGSASASGETQEKQSIAKDVVLNGTYVYNVVFTLTWTDEAAKPLMTNKPDTFQLTVTSPTGVQNQSKQTANDAGGKGTITLTVNYPDSNITKNNGTGTWKVSVSCTDAGDQAGSILGIRTSADTGNAWSLNVAYGYLVPASTK